MATLKLNYCQLIRIILSQIGGSPLQQLYTQLAAGMPTIIRGGPLPEGLAQIKQLVDLITNELANLTSIVNDFNKLTEELAKKFFQNPIASAYDAAIAAIDARMAAIDCAGAGAGSTECIDLAAMRSTLVTFKTNTDLLSGVTSPAGDSGAQCSLQDLLGNGCTKNTDVPDIDLQTILDSFSKKTDIDALATAIQRAILGNLGYTAFQNQLNALKFSLTSINTSFRLTVNRAAIKNAVLSQINQIVFNLLSGCGNNVLDQTIKPEIKTILQPYVELMAKLQQSSTAYISESGKVVTETGEKLVLPSGTVIATVKTDPFSNSLDSNVYIN